jgi:glucan-binding YG repeat protein
MNHIEKTVWLVAVAMAAFSSLAVADAYKCRSKDGKITYTNQPPTVPGVVCEQMFVRKPPVVIEGEQANSEGVEQHPASGDAAEKSASAPEPATAPAAPPKNQGVDEAKRKEAEAANKKSMEEAAAAQKKLKEQNCQNAKANLAAYQTGRVRKVDEKGEWYYLDDAAIKQGLEQAQKDVAENCN